jgi:TonB-linked SusC/RagA family outer membrane protein
MPIHPSRPFARVFRTAIGLYFLFALSGIARADTGKQTGSGEFNSDNASSGKIYVTVRSSSATLQQLFALIEKQTALNFAYDENEVDLTRKVNLKTGQQLLSGLLDLISRQTGLVFTQSKLSILVSQKIVVKKIIVSESKPPVKGTIRDAQGNPLAGATIQLKGTKTSVQTDLNGQFSLDASPGDMLVVSFIGYRTREVTVNGQESLDLKIEELSKDLNEVVVMGYQSQKRSDITGGVSIVNVGDMAKQPMGFADQALQGQASGVRVTQATGQPGDGVAIRIRGVGTINNNDPLFIIDGIPTKDGINFLAADDIATITVLKDAASAAIYGARSSNGVVVITTKTGKIGKAQISYSGYAGVQTHGKLTKMVNAAEYKTLFNEAAANDNAITPNPILQRAPIPDSVPMSNTDWLGAIFQTAPMQDHELSVSGGSEKIQYNISGNVYQQDGIILNSRYKRYTLHAKINAQLTDRLSMGVNSNLSYYDKNSLGSSGDGFGGNGGSVVRYALFRDPAIPIKNPDGSYSDLPPNSNFFGDGYNPVAMANYTDNVEKQYRYFGNVFAEYKILKNLVFRSDFGGDVWISQDHTFNNNYGTNFRVNSPNSLVESNTTSVNMLWNNTLRYNKVFHELHNLSFLVGTEAVSNSTLFQTATDRQFPVQIPSLEFMGNGIGTLTRPVEAPSAWSLFSLLANVNYNYDSKYFLSVNARRDGSSRFGPSDRYGNFFSGSAGWSLHNEEWFRELFPQVSKAKLRASYGQLGNQDIGDYPWASIVGPNYNYVLGSPLAAAVPGYTVSTLGNTNVKWESSTQADAGLDITVLNDRLSLSVDYFVKTTNNMLVQVPLPLIGGSAIPPYQNDGSVQNKGFEFEAGYKNRSRELKWGISANLATLANKVLSLANGTPIQGGRIDNGIFATQTAVGHPIGSFYGYQMTGIFQSQADIFKSAYQGPATRPGDVKYQDVSGDGKIDQNDRTFLGSAIPKFTYGVTLNAEYRAFDLSAFFQGSYGNKIYLQVNQDIEGFYRPFNLTQRVYDQRWHGEGTSNTMPLVSWLDASNNILEPSSRFLEDASYLRLKNLQLGYTLPKRVTERMHIKGLRVYLTSQNLLTITNYTGLDPEMHVSNNVRVEKYPGDVAAGIDWGTYPSAKSYILGVNLNL